SHCSAQRVVKQGTRPCLDRVQPTAIGSPPDSFRLREMASVPDSALVPSAERERGIEKTDELRRLKNARNRKFESISLQQTVSLSPAAAFEGREPRFSARVWAAGLATGSAETRQALHCGPTGGNISVGPYSSTAVPLRWLAKMPRRSRQNWVYSALKVRGSLNSDWAQAKTSTIR